MNCFVVIPTLNAAKDWQRLTRPILETIAPDRVLVLDSSSSDGTAEQARIAGFRVHTIPRPEFNHGGTRQIAVELLPDADILVFLTQDVEFAHPDAIGRLLEAFLDPTIAAAYGRQLPRRGANPIEAHARMYNYSEQSSVRTWAGREQSGFKTIFISNSFAAYRRGALIAVGGFPCDVIFGEDTITAARLIMAGWKIAYVAEALAYHSHDYTWRQEFKRYFDIGVLHSNEAWMLDTFGRASGEGRRFVLSELGYLFQVAKWLIPSALARTAIKLAGYKVGSHEKRLSLTWKRRLSMNPAYWK